jgi:hypothetical protein
LIGTWLREAGFALDKHREILTGMPAKYKVPNMTPGLLVEAMAYLEVDHVPMTFADLDVDAVPAKYQQTLVVRQMVTLQELVRRKDWKKAVIQGNLQLARVIIERMDLGEQLPTFVLTQYKPFAMKHMSAKLFANSVLRRDVGFMERLVNLRCPMDNQAFFNACSFGHLEMVMFLDKVKAPRHPQSLVQAAFKGHLDIVKYLVQTKCPYDHHASIGATRNGYLHIIKYFHDKLGRPVFPELMLNAALRNHVHVARYLVGKGLRPNEATYQIAAYYDCRGVLAFFKSLEH